MQVSPFQYRQSRIIILLRPSLFPVSYLGDSLRKHRGSEVGETTLSTNPVREEMFLSIWSHLSSFWRNHRYLSGVRPEGIVVYPTPSPPEDSSSGHGGRVSDVSTTDTVHQPVEPPKLNAN